MSDPEVFKLCVKPHNYFYGRWPTAYNNPSIGPTPSPTLKLGMALAHFEIKHNVSLIITDNWTLSRNNEDAADFYVECPDDTSTVLFKMQFQDYIDLYIAKADILMRRLDDPLGLSFGPR